MIDAYVLASEELMNEIYAYLAFVDIARQPITLAERLTSYTLKG